MPRGRKAGKKLVKTCKKNPSDLKKTRHLLRCALYKLRYTEKGLKTKGYLERLARNKILKYHLKTEFPADGNDNFYVND